MNPSTKPRDMKSILSSTLTDAIRQGIPILGLLVALNAVLVPASIGIRLALQEPGTIPVGPPTPIPWLDPSTALGQILIHALAGLIVGLFTFSLAKGLIGAAMGVLIDIDHVAALIGFHSAARDGHSVFLLSSLVLLVWGLRLWRWGSLDFALFSTAQFATHFAVAPPGFPLLAPFVSTWFEFPTYAFVSVTMFCVLVGLLNAIKGKGGRDSPIKQVPDTPSFILVGTKAHTRHRTSFGQVAE